MTDIAKKIEVVLTFPREDLSDEDWRDESTKAITKLIEEERAGWVERVAKEVEETKEYCHENNFLFVGGKCASCLEAHVSNIALSDAAAIIRNSKEKEDYKEKYDGLNPKDL